MSEGDLTSWPQYFWNPGYNDSSSICLHQHNKIHHPPDDCRTVPSPKIAPCIFFAFITIVYDIKWSREAHSAATFHSNYHSLPHSACGSDSNQRAPLTPPSTVRPYCTHCLLCPLPSPAGRGVCYWILISSNHIKVLDFKCVILPAHGCWQKAIIRGNL